MSNKSERYAGNRRQFLKTAALVVAAGMTARLRSAGAETVTLPFENGARPLVRYPQKRPLIRLTTRPPQLETPFAVFDQGILTPNDAFFVRYHLSGVPTEIDPEKFRLSVKGSVGTPRQFSLADLKSEFEPVEVTAVNQCSGNGRGFMHPRVPGGQLGNGAMGNARWRGVRLKDILTRTGVSAGAKQAVFNGLDRPLLDATPDFIKALDLEHALDGEVMVAYAMNGENLPMLNGYPLRLVVPGYYGTYWLKHLHEITVMNTVFDGFWMSQAYRIPDTPNAAIPAGTTPKSTVPISRLNVRSFITSVADQATLPVGREAIVRGIAFDGGHGISKVLFSSDDGQAWSEASLGQDLGRYSFREWTISYVPARTGPVALRAKATNLRGETQPLQAGWNPPGYMRNVVETVRVTIV